MIPVSLASIKKKIITIILVLMNVGFFLVVNIYLGETTLQMLGQNNDYILRFGGYYQLFTSMLVHGDIWHLVSNMVFLVIFGLMVENKYSILQYLVIYFVSGFLGNIVSLFVLPQGILNPSTSVNPGLTSISLGASGCIFGVLAAYYISFTAYDKKMIFYAIGTSLLMVVLGIGANINSWAHLFGALGGLILGWIFTRYNVKKQKEHFSKEIQHDENEKWHYRPLNNTEDNDNEMDDEAIPDY